MDKPFFFVKFIFLFCFHVVVEKVEDANDTVIGDDRKDTGSENSPTSSVSEWKTLDDEFEDATDRINQTENDFDVSTSG